MLLVLLPVAALGVEPCDRAGNCPAEVVQIWAEVVAGGCKVAEVEGQLPVTLRALRNVPYASRGYTFKSQELATFFSNTNADGSPWYTPSAATVTLEGPELACVEALKKREEALRKRLPMPAAMETRLLVDHGGEFPTEWRRWIGKGVAGSRVIVGRTDGGGWSVQFYTENVVDGDTFESAITITCDAKGERCEVMAAG
jgi:hypothetical protein